MSGAFGQKPPQPSSNWDIFVNQSQKGKYTKYANQLVAIVSISYDKRDNIKDARLYFTKLVDEKLNCPNFVMIGTSGSNVGVIPAEDNENGKAYTVNRKKINSDQSGMAFVIFTAYAKLKQLKPGVYTAWLDTGVLCFNMQSAPSKP